jgi:hypothetical protein
MADGRHGYGVPLGVALAVDRALSPYAVDSLLPKAAQAILDGRIDR